MLVFFIVICWSQCEASFVNLYLNLSRLTLKSLVTDARRETISLLLKYDEINLRLIVVFCNLQKTTDPPSLTPQPVLKDTKWWQHISVIMLPHCVYWMRCGSMPRREYCAILAAEFDRNITATPDLTTEDGPKAPLMQPPPCSKVFVCLFFITRMSLSLDVWRTVQGVPHLSPNDRWKQAPVHWRTISKSLKE